MYLEHLLFSLLLLSGYYYIGNKIIIFFKIKKIVENISEPFYQNTSIGLVSFIFIFYPIFFLEVYKYSFFLIISLLIIFFGIINFILNINYFVKFFKQIFFNFKKNIFLIYIVYFLIFLFFLLSICPITSGDSVSYHMGVAKFVLENGKFPEDLFYPEAPLVGAGEFLNTFALSVKAYQFTSLINFVGLISIIGILKKFAQNQNLSLDLSYFLYLCILSCPVLVFLISSSKSQLFSISIIFFSYSLLIYCLNTKQDKNNLEKISFILFLFPLVAVQTKISFSLSFFIIISSFFVFFYKRLKIKKFIFVSSLLFIVGLLPQVIWKQLIYDYPFYNFFFNPFPMNIPGFDQIYNEIKNYQVEKFPLILIAPMSFSDLTQFIGLGLLLTFFLFKYKFKNKRIILIMIISFVFIYTIVGQKFPRFYLEIYFFSILALSFVVDKIFKNLSFRILKIGIIFQSIFVICILCVGVFNLLPGTFFEKSNKNVLSKYADGYDLYSWINKVLPENSLTLVNHRSFYFSEKEVIYFGIAGNLTSSNTYADKYFLTKLEEKKPNFILFYGFEENFNFNRYNFKNCLEGIYEKKDNVGFYATRNIFNTKRRYYNAYIYKLNSSKLNNCIIIEKN